MDELRLTKTSQASLSTSPTKKQQKNAKSLSKQEQDEEDGSLICFDQERSNKNTQRFQTQQPIRCQQSDHPYGQSNLRKTQQSSQQNMPNISELFLTSNFESSEMMQQKKIKQADQQADQSNQYDSVAICVEFGDTKNELDQHQSKINGGDDLFQ